MFKIYSKGCEHALCVLTQIPLKNYDQNFGAKDLCRRAGVPETPTRKSLQTLVRAGILQAVSGPGGGYRLIRHPNKISLLAIVQAIDGSDVFDSCIMGLPECSHTQPCPVHHSWNKMKKEMLKEMRSKTLGQLMAATRL